MALCQDFGKGRGRKLIVEKCNLEDVLSKLVYSNASKTGVWGQSPQPLGDFCKFLEKKNYLNPIGSHFARVQSHFKELDF